MTKLQTFSLIGSMVVLTSLATPALAVQFPKFEARVTKIQERKEEIKTNALERLRKNAINEIDRRLKALNQLINRLNEVKRLTSEQKSTLVSQVQSQIDALNSLKIKIQADTDIASLRADKKSIIDSYRIFALYIPKMQIIVNADRILSIIDDMGKISEQLQARITEAKNSGKDVTSIQSQFDERYAKLAEAKTKAQGAIDAVTPLKPEDYPGNKGTLNSARDMLREARRLIQEAHKLAQQIRNQLRAMGVKITLTPTP